MYRVRQSLGSGATSSKKLLYVDLKLSIDVSGSGSVTTLARHSAWGSSQKLEFWRDFKNIVDVIAIVPYYVTLFNVLSTMSCAGAKSSASLAFLRVIRLVRIFKLTKHSVGLQVLLLTFRASLEGLG